MNGLRILVVEDEAGIADFVERGLAAEGYGVDVAADGVEGERRALGDDVDLVILDRMLPGRDGPARRIPSGKFLAAQNLHAVAQPDERAAGACTASTSTSRSCTRAVMPASS